MQRQLNIAMSLWIARDMRPMDTITDNGFKLITENFLPRYHSIGLHVIKRILEGKEEELNCIFTQEMSTILAIAETSDA